MVKQSPTTGKFLKTPKGHKTERMKEVEIELGRTLEEDYYEWYIQSSNTCVN
jgi:hypothetical protein